MRRPERARNLTLISLALAGCALTAIVTLGHGAQKNTWQGAAAVGLATIVFFLLAYLLYVQVEVARHARLRKGVGVLARWLVTPDCWRRFVALNERLNADPDAYRCTIKATLDDRAPGIEVIFGDRSLLIGDDFHSLPVGGFVGIGGPYWRDGPPACIEFSFFSSTTETMTSDAWALRVPVQTGCEQVAAEACRRFEAARPRARNTTARSPRHRLWRNVCLAIALLSGGVLVAGVLLKGQAQGSTGSALLVAALIVGVLVTPATLLMGAVFHFRARAADRSEA